jgi:transposase
MRCHANARLSPIGRRLLVDRVQRDGWTVRVAAWSAGVSERTAWKWLARWRAEGPAGLVDRCSARHRQASTDAQTVAVICALRRLRFTGPEIAGLLGRPSSTVSAILKREGLGKLGRLGLEPARRYQRDRPGELVHIDIKKLGRIQGGAGKRVRDGLRRHYQPTRTDLEGKRRTTVGWEFVHIAIDDATRLAYAEVLGDEKAVTAVGFLRRAITFYASYGIGTQRVMTDTAAPTSQPHTRSPVARWASDICARARGGLRPTAKPNASSAPCSTAGPTARSTPAHTNAPPALTAGWSTTTIDAHTQRSAAKPQSNG